jgi:hypothetical protein
MPKKLPRAPPFKTSPPSLSARRHALPRRQQSRGQLDRFYHIFARRNLREAQQEAFLPQLGQLGVLGRGLPADFRPDSPASSGEESDLRVAPPFPLKMSVTS